MSEKIVRLSNDLDRGDWVSRQHSIDQPGAITPDYNHRWAHPINGRWTRRDLHGWEKRELPNRVK